MYLFESLSRNFHYRSRDTVIFWSRSVQRAYDLRPNKSQKSFALIESVRTSIAQEHRRDILATLAWPRSQETCVFINGEVHFGGEKVFFDALYADARR